MLSSLYAEDVFLLFYSLVQSGRLDVQHQDFSPVLSFHSKIEDGSPLTKNQADYVIKILEKYKNLAAMAGVDYRSHLQNLNWKQPFRVLDLSKKIYVEKTADGKLEICLKFPYQLKKEFDDEINVNLPNSNRVSHWDHEDKVRRLNFYEFNLISLYEFAVKHSFEIDDTFMSVMADVEEIWQNSEDINPYSVVTHMGVELRNCSPDVREWWLYTHTQSYYDDLLLAKSMGYVLKKNPANIAEKIASCPENNFWIKSNNEFFSLASQMRGRVCIVLDRSSNTLDWLKTFVADADKNQVPRDDIKVCFRDSKDLKTGINEWVKIAGVGGKVEDGRILIFESKPAKWLFKEEERVTMLVTNNIYPPTNTMAKEWFNSHPCVIYLGETKPTEQRGQKIVEL
jgi:hypothetical protein